MVEHNLRFADNLAAPATAAAYGGWSAWNLVQEEGLPKSHAYLVTWLQCFPKVFTFQGLGSKSFEGFSQAFRSDLSFQLGNLEINLEFYVVSNEQPLVCTPSSYYIV